MYLPKYFEQSRIEVLHAFIKANPLGALVGLTSGGLVANHIPFELDAAPAPFGSLQGHIARANPFWQESLPRTDALVIFQGPSAYVSPAWYPSKKQTGKVVPTWNYAMVHARGPARFIQDPSWLRAFVDKLTNRYEAGRARPWKITDAPADYLDKQLGAIIGIEIPITSLLGKWKLSQNRPADDREGMVEGWLKEGTPSALAMADFARQTNHSRSS